MACVTLGSVNKDVVGFDPRSIGVCSLWLDAADASTFTFSSGSNISQWRDKSGANNHAVAGSSPIKSTYGIYPVVNFNGSSNYFTSTNTIPGNMHTLIAVHKPFTITGNNQGNTRLFSYQGGNGYVVFPFTNLSSIKGYVTSFDGTTIDGNNSTLRENSQLNRFNIIIAVISSGSQSIYNTGVLQNSNTQSLTNSPATTDPLGIGCFANALTQFYQGDVGEMIIFPTAISNIQRQTIEGYLAWKWGVQANLPATHPFKASFPRANPFSPIRIPDCQLWLDAADLSTITFSSGTSVSQWSDKSGNGWNFTQANASNRPVYTESSTINSLPALSFTGASTPPASAVTQYLDNATFTFNNTGYSIFVVARQNDPAASYTNYNYILKANPSTDFYLFFGAGTTSTKYFATFTGSNTAWNDVSANSPNTLVNVSRILCMIVNGSGAGSLLPYYDGNSMTAKNGTTSTPTGMRIGDASNGNFGQCWNGFVGEIIFFNRAVSASERQQIEGYLAQKWRLRTNLPTTNSFRTAALPNVPLFLPNQLTSALTAWYDGRDPNNNVASIPTNGATLATWTDKSGNAINGTVTGSPAYSLSLRGITFAGSQYYTANISASLSTETIFGVFRVSSLFEEALLAPASVTTGGRQIGIRLTGGVYRLAVARAGVSYVLTNTSVALAINTTYMFTYTAAAGLTLTLSIYGGTAATASSVIAYTAGLTQTQLGANAGASVTSLQGTINELIFVPSTLGTNDIQRIEGYLAWKWNLNGLLPTTHPYYKIRI